MSTGAPPLVLHVIHHLVTGGMENGLVNLIEHMPARAFRHAVACIEDYSEFRQRIRRSDVDVIALHRSRVGVWGVRREIFRLCRRLRPAIVHTRNTSGLDALLPARAAGVRRCIHGEHGWDVTDLRGESRKQIFLRRLHSPMVDRYVTVSQDLRRYLIDRVGIAPSRIEQIYNGVDNLRFTPPVDDRRRTQLPHPLADAAPIVIGTIGRARPVKDQGTLLRAFAEITKRRPDLRESLRLVIVGTGPSFDELKTLARALEIDQCTSLPGACTNIPEVMQALDIFVLPSLNEGISNTILGAMASGLPVVATAVGGNVEIVEDGKWGRLFPPRDVSRLASLIEEYVDQPALRANHGSAARAAAASRFGLESMVQKYQALYESVLLVAPVRRAGSASGLLRAPTAPPRGVDADRPAPTGPAAKPGGPSTLC